MFKKFKKALGMLNTSEMLQLVQIGIAIIALFHMK